MEESIKDKLLHTCTWCNREIPNVSDAFGFGAVVRDGIDLSDKEGEFVALELALSDKTVAAMVPVQSSPIREEGFNLIFVTCSPECAQDLKEALELERDTFQDDL